MSVTGMTFRGLHQLPSIDQRPIPSVQITSMMLDTQQLNKDPVCKSCCAAPVQTLECPGCPHQSYRFNTPQSQNRHCGMQTLYTCEH